MYRPVVVCGRLVMVRGRIQRAGEIVHLVAQSLEDLTGWLDLLMPDRDCAVPAPDGTAIGGRMHPAASPMQHPRNRRVIPKSRDFR